MHKTYLKSFVFEILFVLVIIVKPSMIKFEEYNIIVLASLLEHFGNDIHFFREIKVTP